MNMEAMFSWSETSNFRRNSDFLSWLMNEFHDSIDTAVAILLKDADCIECLSAALDHLCALKINTTMPKDIFR